MQVKIKEFIAHPLISGSSIIFVGSFAANILAYLFNLAMIRLLTVEDYGLLTALTSLTVLFGIFQLSISGIFAKFSAKYKAKDNESGFAQLYSAGLRFVFILAVVLAAILLICIPLFSYVFKIPDIILLVIISFTIIVSIISAFPFGIIQGEMRFWMISVMYILTPIIKIVVAIILIMLGFNVLGVLIAILISSILPTVVGLYIVRKEHRKEISTKMNSSNFFDEFKKYSLFYFLASLGITIITNADILLVRAFFTPEVSGQYSALSLMGKAIFYFTAPIYFVFFPLITQKNERGENYTRILLLTITIVFGITGAISLFYFLFPHVVLSVFAPRDEYQILSHYIGSFSLYMLIFSIANIFNHLFLSLNKIRVYVINLLTAAVFIFSIVLFHDSLWQVIMILIASSSLLLLLYVLYYYRVIHGKN